MAVFFTIKEISDHLLSEILKADADFQIRQGLIGKQLQADLNNSINEKAGIPGEHLQDSASITPLHIDKVEFCFRVQPVRETFWVKLRRLWSKSIPKHDHLYRFVDHGNNSRSLAGGADVKISVSRSLDGGYQGHIVSPVSLTENPDIYVSGFA